MNAELLRLLQTLRAPRMRLLAHPLYERIRGLEELRTFMEHHAFAVWDFMSLLKALQRRLTCCEVPWIPAASPLGARLVNEIVLGEESDEVAPGAYSSHFELYRAAMAETGASTAAVDAFLAHLKGGCPVEQALELAGAPRPAADFVRTTFSLASSTAPAAIAAAFCIGREELIPDMFRRLVDQLDERVPGSCSIFRRYLQRHVQIDQDRHGPLAMQLLAELCGEDASRWREAEAAAQCALEARLALWDAIAAALPHPSPERIAAGR